MSAEGFSGGVTVFVCYVTCFRKCIFNLISSSKQTLVHIYSNAGWDGCSPFLLLSTPPPSLSSPAWNKVVIKFDSSEWVTTGTYFPRAKDGKPDIDAFGKMLPSSIFLVGQREK